MADIAQVVDAFALQNNRISGLVMLRVIVDTATWVCRKEHKNIL
jgi:hypothetical protein